MVLMVSSVNFALKSQDEQMGTLLQFQNFLNSLDFSIQILVQSRKLDITPYIDLLKGRVDETENDLVKIQVREYIQYIQKLTGSYDIMTKAFFVVIPYTASALPTQKNFVSSLFNKEEGVVADDERFEEYALQIQQRALVVEQSLNSVGLRSVRLETEGLIELYYQTFNPDEKKRSTITDEETHQ